MEKNVIFLHEQITRKNCATIVANNSATTDNNHCTQLNEPSSFSVVDNSQPTTIGLPNIDNNKSDNMVVIDTKLGSTNSLSSYSSYFSDSEYAALCFHWVRHVILYSSGLLLYLSFILIGVPLSELLRTFVTLWLFCFYKKKDFCLIDKGADACWATENGVGASASNIVISLKCSGVADLNLLVETFNRKVLQFKDPLCTSSHNKSNSTTASDTTTDQVAQHYCYDRLRYIVVQKFLFYCWQRHVDFAIRDHFNQVVTTPGTEKLERAVYSTCEAFLEHRLPTTKPQWRVTLVSQEGNQETYGLVFCIHHTYGDGLSWVQMLRSALADAKVPLAVEPMSYVGHKKKMPGYDEQSCEEKPSLIRKVKVALLSAHFFACQAPMMWEECNIFHGPFAKQKKTCGSVRVQIPLTEIKAAVRSLNRVPDSGNNTLDSNCAGKGSLPVASTTFTSLISSCIAGAFAKLYEDYSVGSAALREGAIPKKILGILPYAVLPYKKLDPVNQFYGTLLPLPIRSNCHGLSITSSEARLSACDQNVARSNGKYVREVNLLLAHLCGRVIAPLQQLFGISARTTLGFSNVPGPTERLSICGGHMVTAINIFPPLKFRTAIVVGFLSYDDSLNVAMGVDQSVTNSSLFTHKFLLYFEQELAHLVQLANKISDEKKTSSFQSVIVEKFNDSFISLTVPEQTYKIV